MTTTASPRVTEDEILDLLIDASALVAAPVVTDAQWLAYHERKAELLARIAEHDKSETTLLAVRHARGQVRRLRARKTGGASGRWSA